MRAREAIGVSLAVFVAVSASLHAGLIGGGLWRMGSAVPLPEPPPPPPIEVEMVSPSELVQMRRGSRDSKLDNAMAKETPKPDEAKKEPPKPKQVTAPPPPPAAEPPPTEPETKPPEPVKTAAATPPAPAPDAAKVAADQVALEKKLDELGLEKAIEDDKKQAEAAARAKAKAEAEAKAKAETEAKAKAEADAKAAEAKKKADDKKKRELAEAKRKAEEKRKADLAAKEKAKLDTTKLSELFNKIPDQPAPATAPKSSVPTTAKGPVKGTEQGQSANLTGPQADRLGRLIWDTYSEKWDISCGTEGVESIQVKVSIALQRDGRLAQPPRVTNSMPGPLFALMADAALRAVHKAEPVSFPADLYENGWKTFTATFNGKTRCGG